jgi:hypothetical protein
MHKFGICVANGIQWHSPRAAFSQRAAFCSERLFCNEQHLVKSVACSGRRFAVRGSSTAGGISAAIGISAASSIFTASGFSPHATFCSKFGVRVVASDIEGEEDVLHL